MGLAREFDLLSDQLVSGWSSKWRKGGDEALKPKPKGGPKGSAAPRLLSEEEKLRRQAQRLEAENAYLKKLRDLRNQGRPCRRRNTRLLRQASLRRLSLTRSAGLPVVTPRYLYLRQLRVFAFHNSKPSRTYANTTTPYQHASDRSSDPHRNPSAQNQPAHSRERATYPAVQPQQPASHCA